MERNRITIAMGSTMRGFALEGSALADEFMRTTGTTMSVGEPVYRPHFVGERTSRYVFPVVFRRHGRQMTLHFGQSLAAGAAVPTAYDVLACLVKADPGTFDQFTYEYTLGCSPNIRRLYRGVCREWRGVSRLFGDVLDKLADIV